MQSSVARVYVVVNRHKEVRARSLAARSHPKRTDGQARRLLEHSISRDVVTGRDRREKLAQYTVFGLLRSSTLLGHGYTLPDLDVIVRAVMLRSGRLPM